jgi:predicted nucleic acid-binding protein
VEFVLDASFTLHWCFEDEATPASDAVLTRLQNQTDSAWVPGIWPHELLNGLGKGITRKRPRDGRERQKAFSLWQEIRALPIRVIEVPVDDALLDLALHHNLAVYDASYLSLAVSRGLSLATSDDKLAAAAQSVGIHVLRA